MIKRDILNYLNEKIGEIEFEDGTSEEVIQLKLAKYSKAPESSVPQVATRRQILLALFQMFNVKKQDVINFIGTLPEPLRYEAFIWFDESQVFERNNPLLIQMSPMMGIPTGALDELFILAGTL